MFSELDNLFLAMGDYRSLQDTLQLPIETMEK